MSFNPKDAVDAVRDIAANAVEKASDIVENAGHIIRGDIAGGASGIVKDSIDIATHAVDRTKEVLVETSRRALVVRCQTDAAALSASNRAVASRYSCTQRSITVAVFSTLVNCPTTCPTGLNATSTVSFGYLCVALTAMPETMYCNGIPSGFGLSGCSQASVQSLRSIRAGLPVKERLRTVSRLVALTYAAC